MGLSPVATMGQLFDPNVHEAVDLVAVSDREQDGRVVEEVRGGWRAGDRVVRAARVRVGRFVPSGDA
jgi:molecular chaperone GrpE